MSNQKKQSSEYRCLVSSVAAGVAFQGTEPARSRTIEPNDIATVAYDRVRACYRLGKLMLYQLSYSRVREEN
jgi:hypothetical protein